MKKFILGIIVGLLISGTIVFAANYLYQADEVSYDPKDINWNVDNVDSAIKELYNKINEANSALIDLKNTAIAKAVGANGDTFSSVINKLGAITDQKNKSFTVSNTSSITIPAGYYNGTGKINVSGLVPAPSGTFTPSAHGTQIDMGANNTYRYINTTNVWNQAVAAADARANANSANYQAGYNAGKSASGIKSVQRGSFTFTGTGYINVAINSVNTSRTLVLVTAAETSHTNNDNSISPRVTGELTSATNVTFRYSMYDNNMSTTVHYQIIEFSDATVQRGALSGKTGCSGQNVTISSVNTSKSFVIVNGAYSSYSQVTRDNTSPAVSGTLTSATNLAIYWGAYTVSNPIYINWQVVTFP